MKTVIIGGGPAGASLACLLALKGEKPILLTDERVPDLVVGESLIPAVVPLLRRLGIEERVAAMALRKPGVSFVHPEAQNIHFDFRTVADVLPPYAYNVPRPAFDRLLAERAVELGVETLPLRARVVSDDSRSLRLSDDTLAAVPSLKGRQPNLLVDATGRRRLFAKTLNLPAREGPRKDAAYFAHFEGCGMPEPEGQVIITRLERGWSWRIPLSTRRLSIGVVLDRAAGESLGASPEARLEAAMARDPLLATCTQSARRVTDVKTYTNYQLISQQAYGPNWVLLGDAYGFVDPMLSPGLFLAMESAHLLAECLGADSASLAQGLRRYNRSFESWLSSWWELIDHFYSGRIFSLHDAGVQITRQYGERALTRVMQRHITQNLAGMTSGAWTRRRYSRSLVAFTSRYLTWGVPPARVLAIR